MQTTLLDLDALARHLADCIRRSDCHKLNFMLSIQRFKGCLHFAQGSCWQYYWWQWLLQLNQMANFYNWYCFDVIIKSNSFTSSREILDQQDGTIEDDGLTGLLRLATSVLKHKPPFKFSREGQEFLRDVYNLLFLLPSLVDRAQPKCKSHAARAAAYDLLVETVKGSVENYRLLHNWVMSQHMQGEELHFLITFIW